MMNALRQARYRAKGYRVLAEDADTAKIKEIYTNCPDGYEVDHINPLSLGGLHHEDNLQYLPWRVNRSKSNRYVG
jgi:5-methylcytosine-specific restriction endonuclease McrA